MTVLDDIAAQTSELVRLVDTPADPLGYGTDLSCVTDIDFVAGDFVTLDAFLPLAVMQATARRLSTQRGTLLDDLEYGFDIRGLLNRGIPVSDIPLFASQIRSEVLKDDRLDDATVTVVQGPANTLSVKILATLVNSRNSFTFTLAVVDGDTLSAALLSSESNQ